MYFLPRGRDCKLQPGFEVEASRSPSAVAALVVGVLFGVTGALAAGSLLTALLVDIRPRDPVTLLGAIAVLMTAGVVASMLPAWRATRIDPAVAIRAE